MTTPITPSSSMVSFFVLFLYTLLTFFIYIDYAYIPLVQTDRSPLIAMSTILDGTQAKTESIILLFIENGRVQDEPGHDFKKGLREIAKIHKGTFRLTANQHLLVSDVATVHDLMLPVRHCFLSNSCRRSQLFYFVIELAVDALCHYIYI
jgi:hypothetical protein